MVQCLYSCQIRLHFESSLNVQFLSSKQLYIFFVLFLCKSILHNLSLTSQSLLFYRVIHVWICLLLLILVNEFAFFCLEMFLYKFSIMASNFSAGGLSTWDGRDAMNCLHGNKSGFGKSYTIQYYSYLLLWDS